MKYGVAYLGVVHVVQTETADIVTVILGDWG